MGLVKRHRLLAAGAATVVLGLGVLAWLLLSVDEPGPASVSDALARFHDADAEGRSSASGPPDGVYRYRGSGDEHLSLPPLHQADGEVMPGTVTHGADGCWTFRIDFNAVHRQSWRHCRARAAPVAETAGSTGQRWDLGVTSISNTSHFSCDRPDPVRWRPTASAEVHLRCSGTNSAVDGRTTVAATWNFDGETTLQIDGHAVAADHWVGRRRLTGSQEGTESSEAWFRADGLLLRYERDLEVRTDSPVGATTYTEEGWFELTSLTPQR